MRPRGEIREALEQTLGRLVGERGLLVDGTAMDGVPWRDAAEHIAGINPASPADLRLVGHTVENMVRTGELVRVGSFKRAGSRHWEGSYAPAAMVHETPPSAQCDSGAGIVFVMRGLAIDSSD
jgi:hypothetical protein